MFCHSVCYTIKWTENHQFFVFVCVILHQPIIKEDCIPFEMFQKVMLEKLKRSAALVNMMRACYACLYNAQAKNFKVKELPLGYLCNKLKGAKNLVSDFKSDENHSTHVHPHYWV